MMRMRAADAVGVIDDDTVMYVAPLPDGPILVLDEVSALAWRTACEFGPQAVAQAVADATGEDTETVAAPLAAFLDDLVGRGLLVADAQ